VTPARFERIEEDLDGAARRTELLAALLGAGGLAGEAAARVLAGELDALEGSARGVELGALADLAGAMRRVLARLGRVGGDAVSRDVLVLDDNEVTRDLVAMAVQAEGHRVRVTGGLSAFVEAFRQRRPDIILTEASVAGAPGLDFCNFLRHTIATGGTPIVLFAGASGHELRRLAARAGADRAISKDQGVHELTVELRKLFAEILF